MLRYSPKTVKICFGLQTWGGIVSRLTSPCAGHVIDCMKSKQRHLGVFQLHDTHSTDKTGSNVGMGKHTCGRIHTDERPRVKTVLVPDMLVVLIILCES
jgi:hypothetical protein